MGPAPCPKFDVSDLDASVCAYVFDSSDDARGKWQTVAPNQKVKGTPKKSRRRGEAIGRPIIKDSKEVFSLFSRIRPCAAPCRQEEPKNLGLGFVGVRIGCGDRCTNLTSFGI